jgi:hypothetical protein
MGNLGFLHFEGLGAVILVVIVIAVAGALYLSYKLDKGEEEEID